MLRGWRGRLAAEHGQLDPQDGDEALLAPRGCVKDDPFRFPGFLAVGLTLILTFFLAKLGVPAWKQWRDPEQHPLLKRIPRWGDPVAIAIAVKREAAAPHYASRDGWRVTDRFLVLSTFFSFDVLRLEDLLWAYKKVIKHRVNFLPAGTSHAAVLNCYAGTATLRGASASVDEVLAFAAKRAPWARFGFSEELKQHAAQDPRAFCSSIEWRKRTWTPGRPPNS